MSNNYARKYKLSKGIHYREYCYTRDYKFYHNDRKKLTLITRKLYKEKTGESDYIIDKLRNSEYPYQYSDYFFLNTGKVYIPIDWKLFNLIKYFNTIFVTTNCDQGDIQKNSNLVYILFKYSKSLLPFLEENFGKNTITTKNIPFVENHNKIQFEIREITNKNSGKLVKHAFIHFHKNMIPQIHEKLNLEIPDHSKAHKGRRIIHNDLKELFGI